MERFMLYYLCVTCAIIGKAYRKFRRKVGKAMTKIRNMLLSVLLIVFAVTVLFSVPTAAEDDNMNVEAYASHMTIAFGSDARWLVQGAGSVTYSEVHVHTPGDAPTCTTSQCCLTCGEVLVPALGHNRVEIAGVEATCTVSGLTPEMRCLTCGEIFTAHETIPPLGHTPGPEATCAADQVCTGCAIVLAPKLPHTPGPEATCSEEQTCTVCNATLAERLPHTPGADATCTEDQLCVDCGAVVTPATGHLPIAEATCTEPSLCSGCGIELATAFGHTAMSAESVEPTLFGEGKESGEVCATCDIVLSGRESIPSYAMQLVDKIPDTVTIGSVEVSTMTIGVVVGMLLLLLVVVGIIKRR